MGDEVRETFERSDIAIAQMRGDRRRKTHELGHSEPSDRNNQRSV
jgi:hypothetical protein